MILLRALVRVNLVSSFSLVGISNSLMAIYSFTLAMRDVTTNGIALKLLYGRKPDFSLPFARICIEVHIASS